MANKKKEPKPGSLEDLFKKGAFGPQAFNSQSFMNAVYDLYKLEVVTKYLDELDYIDMQVDNMLRFPEADFIIDKIRENIDNE